MIGGGFLQVALLSPAADYSGTMRKCSDVPEAWHITACGVYVTGIHTSGMDVGRQACQWL